MTSRFFSRWTVQSAIGIAVVVLASLGFSSWDMSASQAAPAAAQATSSEGCPAGFYGSPATGCTDVNECASANGGCHKLAMCTNTKGSRECGSCPKDFQGNGYVGCFDVNECPNGDCTDRIPTDGETAAPPVVTTSGDVHGVRARPKRWRPRRLLPAEIRIDVRDRQDRGQLLGVEHPRQAGSRNAHGHGQ